MKKTLKLSTSVITLASILIAPTTTLLGHEKIHSTTGKTITPSKINIKIPARKRSAHVHAEGPGSAIQFKDRTELSLESDGKPIKTTDMVLAKNGGRIHLPGNLYLDTLNRNAAALRAVSSGEIVVNERTLFLKTDPETNYSPLVVAEGGSIKLLGPVIYKGAIRTFLNAGNGGDVSLTDGGEIKGSASISLPFIKVARDGELNLAGGTTSPLTVKIDATSENKLKPTQPISVSAIAIESGGILRVENSNLKATGYPGNINPIVMKVEGVSSDEDKTKNTRIEINDATFDASDSEGTFLYIDRGASPTEVTLRDHVNISEGKRVEGNMVIARSDLILNAKQAWGSRLAGNIMVEAGHTSFLLGDTQDPNENNPIAQESSAAQNGVSPEPYRAYSIAAGNNEQGTAHQAPDAITYKGNIFTKATASASIEIGGNAEFNGFLHHTSEKPGIVSLNAGAKWDGNITVENGRFALSANNSQATSQILVTDNGIFSANLSNSAIWYGNLVNKSSKTSQIELRNGSTWSGGVSGHNGSSTIVSIADGSIFNGDVKTHVNANYDMKLEDRSHWLGASHGEEFSTQNITIGQYSQWRITADSTVTGKLSNAGYIGFQESDGYISLTADSYAGNNGAIRFNTELGDESRADQLAILKSASGLTRIKLEKTGPGGMTDAYGIPLVTMDSNQHGFDSTTFKLDEGNFSLGAYTYELEKRVAINKVSGEKSGWFLRSSRSASSAPGQPTAAPRATVILPPAEGPTASPTPLDDPSTSGAAPVASTSTSLYPPIPELRDDSDVNPSDAHAPEPQADAGSTASGDGRHDTMLKELDEAIGTLNTQIDAIGEPGPSTIAEKPDDNLANHRKDGRQAGFNGITAETNEIIAEIHDGSVDDAFCRNVISQQLAKRTEELEEARLELDALRQELRTTNERVTQSEGALKVTQDELAHAKKHASEAEEQATQARDAAALSAQTLTRNEEEARQRLAHAESALGDAKQRAADAEQRAVDANVKVAEGSKALEQAGDLAQTRFNEVEAARAAIQLELDQTQQLVANAEQQAAEAQRRLADATWALEDNQNKTQTLVATAEANLATFKQQLDEAVERAEAAEAATKQAREEAAAHRDLLQSGSEALQRAQQAEAVLATLRQERDQASNRANAAEQSAAEAHNAADMFKQNLMRVEQEARQRIADSDSALEEARLELATSRQHALDAEKQAKDAHDDADQVRIRLEQTHHHAKQYAEQSRAELAEFRKQLDFANKRLADAEKRANEAHEEGAQQRIQQAEAELSELRHERDMANRRAADAEQRAQNVDAEAAREIQVLKQAENVAQTRFNEAEAARAAIQHELEQTQQLVANAEQQAAEARENSTEAARALQHNQRETQRLAEVAEANLATFRQQLDEAVERAEAAEAATKQAREEAAAHRDLLQSGSEALQRAQQAEAVLATLRQERDQANERANEARSQANRLLQTQAQSGAEAEARLAEAKAAQAATQRELDDATQRATEAERQAVLKHEEADRAVQAMQQHEIEAQRNAQAAAAQLADYQARLDTVSGRVDLAEREAREARDAAQQLADGQPVDMQAHLRLQQAEAQLAETRQELEQARENARSAGLAAEAAVTLAMEQQEGLQLSNAKLREQRDAAEVAAVAAKAAAIAANAAAQEARENHQDAEALAQANERLRRAEEKYRAERARAADLEKLAEAAENQMLLAQAALAETRMEAAKARQQSARDESPNAPEKPRAPKKPNNIDKPAPAPKPAAEPAIPLIADGKGGYITPMYRAETALYAAIPDLARTLSLATAGSRYDRHGASLLRGGADGDKLSFAGSWARAFGGAITEGDSKSLTPSVNGYYAGFQIGADLVGYNSSIGEGRFGLFGGYAMADARVRGFVEGEINKAAGSLTLSATSGGLYWTHTGPGGWYADVTVTGSHYVSGGKSINGIAPKTNGRGLTIAAEAGLPIMLGHGLSFTPQAQVVYRMLDMKPARDQASTMEFQTHSGARIKVGGRMSWEGVLNGVNFRPFIQAGIWTETGKIDRTIYNGVTPIASGSATRGADVDVGLEASVSDRLAIWGSAGVTRDLKRPEGNADRNAWRLKAGIRYHW